MPSELQQQLPVSEAVGIVRAHAGVAELAGYGVFEVAGPDAPRFLQNRLSNDVLALGPGQGHLNAALDRQAKIQGVFSLHRLDEERFFGLMEREALSHALAEIEKYHIVENFRSEDVSGRWRIFTVQGQKSTNVVKKIGLPVPAAPFAFAEQDGIRIIRRSLSGEDGFVFMAPAGAAEAFWQALIDAVREASGISVNDAVLEILRVEAGLPRFCADYDTETLLPETGLERSAVSYTKGCYLGQETVARVKTYGMVQRALAGLLFDPALPEPPPSGNEIRLNGKVAGVLKSAVYSPTLGCPVAMAYLGKAERVPGRELAVEIAGKTYSVTVTLLPFVENECKDGEQLLNEGLKLYSEGFDEEAMRVLRKAIEADPERVEAYEALGVILGRHEQYDEAIALMHRILERDPDHVMAHTNLSVFYMKQEAPGWKEKAEEEKARATTAAFKKKMKESGLPLPDPEAERRKKMQALEERVSMFREALKFNPDDPLGNFGLGSSLLELQRWEEAIEPLRKTIQAQPKHTVAYLSLGKALEGAGCANEAKEVYGKGVEVAAAKGDLMPLKEMQARLESLE